MNLKKITSFAAALALSVGMTTGFLDNSTITISAKKTPKYYHTGDVNDDGKINITDVTLVAAHIKGKKKLGYWAQINADVNWDGKVNVSDLNLIAAHVKGKYVIIPEEYIEDELTGDAEDACDEDLA